MLVSLALPILLSAIALFFASFLSWMILQLHKKDWAKLAKEDEFLAAAAKCDIPPGSYMFPGTCSPKEMQSEEFQKKYAAGPRGVPVCPGGSKPPNGSGSQAVASNGGGSVSG